MEFKKYNKNILTLYTDSSLTNNNPHLMTYIEVPG